MVFWKKLCLVNIRFNLKRISKNKAENKISLLNICLYLRFKWIIIKTLNIIKINIISMESLDQYLDHIVCVRAQRLPQIKVIVKKINMVFDLYLNILFFFKILYNHIIVITYNKGGWIL